MDIVLFNTWLCDTVLWWTHIIPHFQFSHPLSSLTLFSLQLSYCVSSYFSFSSLVSVSSCSFHSPMKVVGHHLKASVRRAGFYLGVCGCLWACIISPCDQTLWKWITETVQVDQDFLSQSSTWNLVDCSSALHLLFIQAEREWNRRDTEKERWKECLIWYACMWIFVCVHRDVKTSSQPTVWGHLLTTSNS